MLKSTDFRCPVLPRRTFNFLFALLGFIISKPNPKHHGCPGIVFFGSVERLSRLNLLCPRSKNLFALSSPWTSPVGKDRQKASKIFWTWPNYTPSKMLPLFRSRQSRWAPLCTLWRTWQNYTPSKMRTFRTYTPSKMCTYRRRTYRGPTYTPTTGLSNMVIQFVGFSSGVHKIRKFFA